MDNIYNEENEKINTEANNIEKKKIFKIKLIVIFIVILYMAIMFFRTHSTFYKYNDQWIIGRTQEEIEAMYGEFTYKEDDKAAYYMYMFKDMFSDIESPCYYVVFFDEIGRAYDIAEYIMN